MTLAELLKAQNLTDEQINAIAAAMKENKIFTAGEENLDIRYGKLKTDFDGLTKQHSEAQTLIEQLKKSNKGNEELQGKIGTYETQVAELQKELEETKVKAAIKVGLLEAKAMDIDYLTFKLGEKGEIKLDENGNIEGWDDKLAGLKTQFPTQFESAQNRKVDPKPLPGTDPDGNGLTRKELLRKPYDERMKLYNENPEAYKTAMQK